MSQPALNGMSEDRNREIQDLIDLLKRNNLAELEVEHGGVRIRLRREVASVPLPTPTWETVQPGLEPSVEPQAGSLSGDSIPGMVTVRSPIVGTFYRSPAPDADPYVEEGDQVKKGQVLCIVEAMKLMNEIEAEVDGRIAKVLAESTKPVEYGQSLFLIEPTSAS